MLLALQEVRAANLQDLHRITGVPKGGLLRILTTLSGRGLVHQRLADGAFLASTSLARRSLADAAVWLVEAAGPALQELGRRVLWPTILSVPRRDHMETVDAVRTRHAGVYFDDYPIPPIGFRSALLRGASGRAHLTWCPDREREATASVAPATLAPTPRSVPRAASRRERWSCAGSTRRCTTGVRASQCGATCGIMSCAMSAARMSATSRGSSSERPVWVCTRRSR